jgi:chromate transporter
MNLSLGAADWLALLAHFATLSLLGVGGAITTAPDMHRYLVGDRMWLSDAQFASSIALAQAAPGPNILFVGLLGWNVGLHSGGYAMALLGLVVTLTGILVPSSLLTYLSARWGHRNRELRAVRAFKQGMAPIVVALMVATAWLLTTTHGSTVQNAPLWALTVVAALLVWRTRIHLLWLMAAGALLGAAGWV